MKTVSIIIPAHNHGLYLAETLDSVLNQGVKDFEIIIVNDGSTDNTGDIADAYARKFGDQKVVCIKQKQGGPSAARNVALKRAQGRYISFIDADDLAIQGTLQKRIDYLDAHADVMLVCADVTNFGEQGTIDESYFRSRNIYSDFKAAGFKFEDLFSFILKVCMAFTSTVVVRRECLEALGGFDESFPVGEDKELYFRLGRRYKMIALPEIMVRRRIHATNISHGEVIRRKSYLAIAQKIQREDPQYYEANRELFHRWLTHLHYEGGYYLYKDGQYGSAALELLKSLSRRPTLNALYYLFISLISGLLGKQLIAKLKGH